MYHKELTVDTADGRIRVTLDIVPDEDDPHGLLAAEDIAGEQLARVRVKATHKLSLANATAWIDGGYGKPQ